MKADFGCRPLSISGISLEGNRIVRTIYLDESGTSSKSLSRWSAVSSSTQTGNGSQLRFI